MSLTRARSVDETPLPELPAGPPFRCADLERWRSFRFMLPPSDPRLTALFDGGPAACPEHEGLVGATKAWEKHAEWMDFLDPASPSNAAKGLERDIYLHFWGESLRKAHRVLDVGGGIGRFAMVALDAGASVDIVDADLRSLWRALWHARGRKGAIDLHWALAEDLLSLDLGLFDLVIASEILCYCSHPEAVVDAIRRSMVPDGVLLVSVEAPFGWAASPDAAEGSLEALFTGDPLVVPEDRFVRTYDEQALRAVLRPFVIQEFVPTHYTAGGPFAYASEGAPMARILDWEARCRQNSVIRPWNRAWTVVASL
jgi:SAM-dependent methyltransferase